MTHPVIFTISGVPLSAQAGGRRHWQDRVRGIAAEAWGDTAPLVSELSIVIVYYFTRSGLDVDNLAKPILDALKGHIFLDDAQVTQVLSRKTELVRGLTVAGVPPDIARQFDEQNDFVLVKIGGPPNHEELP